MTIQFHKNHIRRIKDQLEKIESKDQILFLSHELERFREWNSGEEANEVIRWYEGKIAQVERQIFNNSEKRKGKRKTENTFHWKGSEDLLKALFEGMKQNLIAKDTEWVNFNLIFSDSPLEKIKKIEWKQSSALLAYFIYTLYNSNNMISFEDNHWVIAEICFTKSKHLKQTNQNRLAYNKKTRNAHFVDDLFKSLKVYQ